MLRRLLPVVRRGIASSAVPGATHRVSASHGGAVLPHASDLPGPIAVLPGCQRCPSSATTSSSLLSPVRSSSAATSPCSSLLPPQGPPQNGRRGFTTTSPSPVWKTPIFVNTPTQIDWSQYIHVKEFDCCGQELCTDSVSLKDYVAKNPRTELRKIYGNKLNEVDPYNNPVKEEDLFVKDSAKKHAKNLIDGMAEIHSAGVCMMKLDHTNIVVVASGRVMKYTGLIFVEATLELKKKNFVWLKTVLKEDLFEGKPVSHDMKRLFEIVETKAVDAEYLMRNYIALVPQVNKSAFYLRLHEPLKVLIFREPGDGKTILGKLPFRSVWRHLMQLNVVLDSMFTHGKGYDTKDDPFIFALCFKHCCYHKLDRCCDPRTKIQLFDAEMFEDIQESTFPGYVGALEEALEPGLQAAKVDELL